MPNNYKTNNILPHDYMWYMQRHAVAKFHLGFSWRGGGADTTFTEKEIEPCAWNLLLYPYIIPTNEQFTWHFIVNFPCFYCLYYTLPSNCTCFLAHSEVNSTDRKYRHIHHTTGIEDVYTWLYMHTMYYMIVCSVVDTYWWKYSVYLSDPISYACLFW